MIVSSESKVVKKKKKGVSKPEEASFYGWQQHVSQVIFKAWNPSARNPPHLLHNSSLLHNLFYFFCKVLLIFQNIHPLALSLKYLWGSSAGKKKSKFAFIRCQCKQKALGTINSFSSCSAIYQCLFQFHFYLFAWTYVVAVLASLCCCTSAGKVVSSRQSVTIKHKRRITKAFHVSVKHYTLDISRSFRRRAIQRKRG